MLFSNNFYDKLIAWLIAIWVVGILVFMLCFNELTRALLGMSVFYYLFGGLIWHLFGRNDRVTFAYEAVSLLVRWLWKGD